MRTIALHPPLLSRYCLAEIGERFSFHAMRGILVLYMVKVFGFSNLMTYEIFAAFTALLYFTPLMGGYLADQFVGTKHAVVLGGALLATGYFLLAASTEHDYFYFALALIAIGNGFFMPNIANSVGELYHNQHSLRESGFSIFYAALNIGAFLPPFITAFLIVQFGWQAAFFVSGISVMLATLILLTIKSGKYTFSLKNTSLLITILLCAFFLLVQLIQHYHTTSLIIFFISFLFVVYAMQQSTRYPRAERRQLLACFILTGFSVLFWMLAEQTAMSLTLFTEYNVQRDIHGYTVPTLFFFSLNPFFIIACGPLFSKLWIWLDGKHLNPSVPTKFALGTLLMGIGFAILPLAIAFKNSAGQIQLSWLVFSYFLQSCGELLLSPIGLSMISKLTPKKMLGLMMGIWYLATALAYLLAGYAAQWTAVPSGSNLPQDTAPIFAIVFGTLGWITIAAGVIMMMFVPMLKEIMNGEQNTAIRASSPV